MQQWLKESVKCSSAKTRKEVLCARTQRRILFIKYTPWPAHLTHANAYKVSKMLSANACLYLCGLRFWWIFLVVWCVEVDDGFDSFGMKENE